jgi:hypothetical protein
MCRQGQLHLVDSRQSHKADLISARITHVKRRMSRTKLASLAATSAAAQCSNAPTNPAASARDRLGPVHAVPP